MPYRRLTCVWWVLACPGGHNPKLRGDLGGILVANSPTLTGQDTTKAVFPPGRTVSMHTGYPPPDLGESPRKPLCRASGTGGSNPPLSASESQERLARPGPCGRVFASLGRVRWQFGGKLGNTYGDETDERTPDDGSRHLPDITSPCPDPEKSSHEEPARPVAASRVLFFRPADSFLSPRGLWAVSGL